LIAPSLPENAIFYDLGSGLGKVVIAASLLYPFSKVIGIEILEPLFNCSKKRQANLLKLHNESKQKCIMMAKDIDFVHGSFLTTSWADADVIFCHGTCLSDSEWSEISLAAEKLKQGAYFISTSHILHTALFEVINNQTFRMSWGTCTLYIHVSLAEQMNVYTTIDCI
jgi:SAM-dependent methyltransferase